MPTKKYLKTQRKCMRRLRQEGRDKWRNTKRQDYNKKKYAKSVPTAYNRKQPWTIKDMNKVLERQKPDLDLGYEIGRSVQAIQVMRVRLKKENKRWH